MRQLTQKQRLQLEIIDIDHDLQQLALRYPNSKSLVDRIQNTLGNCVHMLDGCDVREFCSCHNNLAEA